MMGSCNMQSAASVAEAWVAIAGSNYEPEERQQAQDELYGAMAQLVYQAQTPQQLEEADAGCRRIMSCCPDERIGALLQQIATRREAVTQPADVASRTYRGILLDSPEQVPIAMEEERLIEVIMRSVSRDNINSILNAMNQVSACTTRIKEPALETLNRYKTEFEERQRTFRGVLYDTVQQAADAQQIYLTASQNMQMLDYANEEMVRTLRDQFAATQSPHLKEFVEKLDQCLRDIDLRKRTVDGFLFDTVEQAQEAARELPQIRQLMTGFDKRNEPAMLELQEKLSAFRTQVKDRYLQIVAEGLREYDIACRTFGGRLYDTRQEADLLRRENARIQEILQQVAYEREDSMLQAKKALEELETSLKNDPIAMLNEKLRQYDIRVRTVRGVLYPTREEAQLVTREYMQLDQIMSRVSADDEQSILQAQREVLTLTSGIKENAYQQLKRMWEAYDLKMRTFMGMVFETREQVREAAQTRGEFMKMVSTFNLQDPQSILRMEGYVQAVLQEKIRPEALQIIAAIKKLNNDISWVIATDNRINPVANKKESQELYKFAEALIPQMQRHRMPTAQIETIMRRHYSALNMGQKFMRIFK